MKSVVDLLKLAKKGESVDGDLTDFPRLVGDVIEKAEVRYRLEGLPSDSGEVSVALTMAVAVTATCQRCLEPMDLALDFAKRYRLVPESQMPIAIEEEDLSDEVAEALPIGSPVNLAELIEDELLLALPSSPKHEECEFILQSSQ